MTIALAVVFALFLSAEAFVQRQIPTGGPIPDRRGFRGVNDPRYADVIKNGVITRRVAGQIYVVAGAGGNVEVFAGDDRIMLVDDNFQVFQGVRRPVCHRKLCAKRRSEQHAVVRADVQRGEGARGDPVRQERGGRRADSRRNI